jgi:hypothetical protein
MVRICVPQPVNNEAESGLTAIEKNRRRQPVSGPAAFDIGCRNNSSDIRTLFKVESRDIRTLLFAMVRPVDGFDLPD